MCVYILSMPPFNQCTVKILLINKSGNILWATLCASVFDKHGYTRCFEADVWASGM